MAKNKNFGTFFGLWPKNALNFPAKKFRRKRPKFLPLTNPKVKILQKFNPDLKIWCIPHGQNMVGDEIFWTIFGLCLENT